MAREIRFNCWSCKTEIVLEEKITRNDFCPQCDMPLKCCYNCKFYDRDAHHQCAETQAEWVRYKEKANLCSYFIARPPGEGSPRIAEPKVKATTKPGRDGTRSREDEPKRSPGDKKKAAWNSLFRDD